MDGPSHHWHTLDVGDEHRSLTRTVAEHRSTTSTTTTLLLETVGEHSIGSKKSWFATRMTCYRRGNHDAVTHPLVATTDALLLVEAGSQAYRKDLQDHQA